LAGHDDIVPGSRVVECPSGRIDIALALTDGDSSPGYVSVGVIRAAQNASQSRYSRRRRHPTACSGNAVQRRIQQPGMDRRPA
jgi:hypothetical protein